MRLPFVIRGVLIVAVVLTSMPLVTAASAFSASQPATPPVPVQHHGQIGPAHITSPAFARSAPPTQRARRLLPFLPRNAAAFEQAKTATNAGRSPARGSVPTTTLAGPRTAVSPLQAEQGVTSFPVMSYEEQISQICGPFSCDQAVQPPDTQLAAGPTYLLETLNDSGSVWTKSGGLVTSFDLNTFFPVPFGYSFSDPRDLYDPLSGRWFVSGLSFDSANDSQVYVAVSATSDPTGSWYTYTVESNTAGVLYDQPKIGVSSDKVVISWNDYSGGSFTGQETWVLQKSDLLAGGAYYYWYFGPDPNRFDVVPSESLTSTSTEYLVYNDSDPHLNQNLSYPSLGVVAINGTPAQGNVTWNESDPAIIATSLPPDAVQPSGPLIATDDDRLLSAVWQNGNLWTTGNDYCSTTGYSCLRLIQVSTGGSSPTILQDFDVGWSSGYLFFPAVTLDIYGDAFFSFSASSASLWASTATTAQPASGSAGSDEGLFLVQDGLGSYNDCASSCTYSNNRWGDYSAAAPDPANGSAVWVTGEYAASSTDSYDWGTATGEMILTTPPTVTPTPVPSATPTSRPSPTSTPAGSATPTSTSTPTPSPTTTAVPSPTPTSTPTSTPTPFRVFVPVVFDNATSGP